MVSLNDIKSGTRNFNKVLSIVLVYTNNLLGTNVFIRSVKVHSVVNFLLLKWREIFLKVNSK